MSIERVEIQSGLTVGVGVLGDNPCADLCKDGVDWYIYDVGGSNS